MRLIITWAFPHSHKPFSQSHEAFHAHMRLSTLIWGFPHSHEAFYTHMCLSPLTWAFPHSHKPCFTYRSLSTLTWEFLYSHEPFHTHMYLSTLTWAFPHIHGPYHMRIRVKIASMISEMYHIKVYLTHTVFKMEIDNRKAKSVSEWSIVTSGPWYIDSE
jgi:hypothetical protein